MRKTKLEMIENILSTMITKNTVSDTTPGSVARTFTEVLVEEFYQFYEQLDVLAMMSFVSTASGSYLNLIGQLLACERDAGESDDNYRYRITNQVYVMQGANLTSLRINILRIDGVADVKFKRFTHGAGSFTCYIIPENFPLSNNLINTVQSEVDKVAAYGIYGEVKASTSIPVDLNLNLIFSTSTTNAERQSIRQKIVANVEGYVNKLQMGQGIIINELIKQSMNASHKVEDLQISSLVVNEVSQYIRNIYPKTEEQYFLRKISVV